MDKLYIVMPAYNEEANIEESVRSWYAILEGKSENSRLVVADAGSKDRTHEILCRLQQDMPRLEILSASDRQHGPKVIALYNYAISKGADYVFQTDSDGQTNPMEFEKFWNLRAQYDAIIGNRVVRGDGRIRAFVERIVCILLRLYFGIRVPDANAPFRLMKSEIVKKYLVNLPAEYNLPNIMLTTYWVYYSEKVSFVDISFKARQGGKNTINISRIIKIGMQALRDFKYFKREMAQTVGYATEKEK